MFRGLIAAPVVALFGLVGSTSLKALDACTSLGGNVSFSAGQLFDQRSLSPVTQFSGTPLQRPSNGLKLIYVVQTGGNGTGALIIKTRHRLPEKANAKNSEGFPSGDLIQLSRTEYYSPCKKGAYVGAWEGRVRLSQYVDQHYYGTNYPWRKQFHADSSYRTEPFLYLFTRGICKNTYDPDTRASFLYSENPMVASDTQVAARRLEIAASKTGLISEAFADSAEFYRSKLQTMIIPYNRAAIAPKNCVSFGIDIPKEAGSTSLEIIDSELGGRQTWQVQWLETRQN
jgi:hypothetical protein